MTVHQPVKIRALCCVTVLSAFVPHGIDDDPAHMRRRESSKPHPEEDVGLLVQVGFDIAAFTPPAYQRGSLPRPSKDVLEGRFVYL